LRDGPDERVLLKCFNPECDPADVIAELTRRSLWPGRSFRSSSRAGRGNEQAKSRADVKERKTSPKAQRIWYESIDPQGTLSQAYLEQRGVGLPPQVAARTLRHHPYCPFEDTRRPCLIAAFLPILGDDDPAAPPRAIHRIALLPEGRGHDGKRMLGPAGGCAVKLSPAAHITSSLGIAEGIETALAVMAAGWKPVWAVGSAGGIEQFPVLPDIQHLTIFADNDASGTGQRAAKICAERWLRAGIRADIYTTREVGTDWADAWAARGHRL
jgi:hypothetical protein